MTVEGDGSGTIAFALVYLTFFLDNVLLTVLVPIIPDWVSPTSLAQWQAPLATLLNHTLQHAAGSNPDSSSEHYLEVTGSASSTALVGVVLGGKAAAQLAVAPGAAAAVCRAGPAAVLRAAAATLALAATVFWGCSVCGGGAGCAALGRVLHGAGAAGAGVAGLALAARAAPGKIPALLGAVALGVLVGYPAGGALRADLAFLLLASALLADLAMQHMFLNKEEYNQPTPQGRNVGLCGWGGAWAAARRKPAAACAGCVLATTAVMSALEPALPAWIKQRFHAQHWVVGVVFIPDSIGYVAGTALGGAALALGVERLALAGQLAVAGAALALPHAASVVWLILPHLTLGLGLGAADAALVPALLALSPRRAPHRAALLQAASSAAAAAGPALGGALSWAAGFPATLRTLAVINILYAGFLYTQLKAHPLSPQWGASTPGEDDSDDEEKMEDTPLQPQQYTALH